MIVDVLGYQCIDFKDRDTGRQVSGYSVFFAEPIRERGEGTAYVKKFVPSDRVMGKIGLGRAEFNIQLSMSGKPFVESFVMIPPDSAKAAASK